MAEDLIRYDVLAQEALRGLVRKVLSEVAQAGLPGEHHFFITFDTRHPGVRISSRLKEQYPADMTVVLQHQFWDLAVSESAFEVGLSFKGVPERLVVPFRAVQSFVDPHANFALKFEPALTPVAGNNDEPAPAEIEPGAVPSESTRPGPEAGGTADVVSLDAFRKKS
jgi:hypothetical protein